MRGATSRSGRARRACADVRIATAPALSMPSAHACHTRRETVKASGWILLAGLAAATGQAVAKEKAARKAAPRGVTPAALIAATKAAMLSEIDYGRELCDGDRDVETWIKDVVGETAATIEWRGGPCELTNDLNPLDAGSDWCGGATIVPKGHAKEPAAIEVYFEKPVNGKPGKPYAFRGVNYDVDGLDYKRDWPSFEYGYRQKYEKGFVWPEAADCD